MAALGALPPLAAATFDRICREVAGRPAPTRRGSLAEPGEAEGTAIAPAREPD